ncbi:hypothetical protein ACOHYD_13210 [Desulfobacterota bacterium M19]
MSRPLRIEYPGAWHHVMNRGRRREEIFFTDADREGFINVLRESAELWNFEELLMGTGQANSTWSGNLTIPSCFIKIPLNAPFQAFPLHPVGPLKKI